MNTAEDETTPSDGKCSLREAIANANDNAQTYPECKAGSGEDRIVFKLGKNATITLDPSLRQLTVTDASGLTIDGGKSKDVTVSGGDQTRAFQVNAGAKLAIRTLTVVDGAADVGGGGAFNDDGTLTVSNSTFSANTNSGNFGGGIFNGRTATLRNTIVANSPSGGNCSGPVTDGGYNIDTDGTCVDETVTTSKTTDPLLDPAGLADNGGPTQTIALQPTSPAIDVIPEGTNDCRTEIKTDQRGVKRPQGPACDGAGPMS